MLSNRPVSSASCHKHYLALLMLRIQGHPILMGRKHTGKVSLGIYQRPFNLKTKSLTSSHNSLPLHACHLCLVFVVKVWGRDQLSVLCSIFRASKLWWSWQSATPAPLSNLMTRTTSQMLQEASQRMRHHCHGLASLSGTKTQSRLHGIDWTWGLQLSKYYNSLQW